jgi:hypothetical protein
VPRQQYPRELKIATMRELDSGKSVGEVARRTGGCVETEPLHEIAVDVDLAIIITESGGVIYGARPMMFFPWTPKCCAAANR